MEAADPIGSSRVEVAWLPGGGHNRSDNLGLAEALFHRPRPSPIELLHQRRALLPLLLVDPTTDG